MKASELNVKLARAWLQNHSLYVVVSPTEKYRIIDVKRKQGVLFAKPLTAYSHEWHVIPSDTLIEEIR